MATAAASGSYTAVAGGIQTASVTGSYSAVASGGVRTATVSSSYIAVAPADEQIFELYHWLGSEVLAKTNLYRWDGSRLWSLSGDSTPAIPAPTAPVASFAANPVEGDTPLTVFFSNTTVESTVGAYGTAAYDKSTYAP